MIQAYTGTGKGKTTAALGLAVRASGAGLHVYIMQFAKGKNCCELNTLRKIRNIKIEQCGGSCFIAGKPNKTDKTMAVRGLAKAEEAILHSKYEVIILDEIFVALHLGLLSIKALLKILVSAPPEKELILTGRWAPREIIRLADLVSDIKEIKHYYKNGVKARKGIEY